ncbi:MAG: ABC transporter permease [Vicinamibacterales bacterium]
MNAVAFAARSLVRQPARAALGIAGVAAVGALLFDMLLLSSGLVISMRQMLATTGFNLRAGVGTAPPGSGPLIEEAGRITDRLAALPEVARVTPVRFTGGVVVRAPRPFGVRVMGARAGGQGAWTVVAGRDIRAAGEVVINERVRGLLNAAMGSAFDLRTTTAGVRTVAPPLAVRIVGVAEFPFESEYGATIGLSLADVDRVAGGSGRESAEQFLMTTAEGVTPVQGKAAVERAVPELTALTNAQVLVRLQEGGLSYFRQISFVLTTITTGFAFLLVTVLLTVSVNQRTGEIAALRALGFSRRRAVMDVFAEAGLIVGSGAVLALPLGLALARLLDWILKAIPGIPASLHFFVFQPRALVVHGVLFALTAVAAALYPMRLVAVLPIAATLRREVVS